MPIQESAPAGGKSPWERLRSVSRILQDAEKSRLNRAENLILDLAVNKGFNIPEKKADGEINHYEVRLVNGSRKLKATLERNEYTDGTKSLDIKIEELFHYDGKKRTIEISRSTHEESTQNYTYEPVNDMGAVFDLPINDALKFLKVIASSKFDSAGTSAAFDKEKTKVEKKKSEGQNLDISWPEVNSSTL